jgi:hypothetical protein
MNFIRGRIKSDLINEKNSVRLEQDRIFHTCHLLPINYSEYIFIIFTTYVLQYKKFAL